MTSPVAYLHENVLLTLRTIAPEWKEEFNRLDIKLRLDTEEQRIRFAAELAGKEIIVGTACLERLWAIAFAYYRFYREIASRRVADQTNRIVDLRRTPELREAGDLLRWAIEVDHQPYGELESVDAIRQEKEAEWILGGLPDEHHPMFEKRALGVCMGLVWIAALYVYAGAKWRHDYGDRPRLAGRSHPLAAA